MRPQNVNLSHHCCKETKIRFRDQCIYRAPSLLAPAYPFTFMSSNALEIQKRRLDKNTLFFKKATSNIRRSNKYVYIKTEDKLLFYGTHRQKGKLGQFCSFKPAG